MKKVLIPLLAAAIVAVLVWLGFLRPSTDHRGALNIRELACRGLADHLAKSGQARRVLVVANPFVKLGKLPREMLDMEAAGLRGLHAGFGAQAVTILAWPELKPGVRENPRAVFIDPETTTPLSYLVGEDAFDILAQAHADCDVILSLIGLPADLARVRCWQRGDGPKFALLLPDLRIIGNRAAIRRCLDSGKLIAFVVTKPGSSATRVAVHADARAEFEKLFVLVTHETVEATMRTYPQLFPAN
jgi:hypothetical protein